MSAGVRSLVPLLIVIAGCGRGAEPSLARGGSDTTATDAAGRQAGATAADPCAAARDTSLAHATTDSARAVRAARLAYADAPSGLPLAVLRFEREAGGVAVVQLRPADALICPGATRDEVTDGTREYRVRPDGAAEQIPGRP